MLVEVDWVNEELVLEEYELQVVFVGAAIIRDNVEVQRSVGTNSISVVILVLLQVLSVIHKELAHFLKFRQQVNWGLLLNKHRLVLSDLLSHIG